MSGTIKLRRSSLCVAKLSDYSTACQIAQHTTILRSAGATTGAFSFVPSAPVITLPHIRSASWDAPPLGGASHRNSRHGIRLGGQERNMLSDVHQR